LLAGVSGVLVLEPEFVMLVLVLFGAAGKVVVLFGEDADSAGGDFVADYGLYCPRLRYRCRIPWLGG
jgi:hypothetical protein